MSEERYDLIVLGSGSAGRDAAGQASREFGARVAIIERERWGGSCPNVACRPTKAYVLAAELMHDVRDHAAERGISLPEPTIDLAQTRRWKDSLRRDQNSWLELLRKAGYGTYAGQGVFADAGTIQVNGATLSADRILIATGGRTAVPSIPGLETVEWLDHVSALELEEVPASLLVVGGGPVGLELAQVFSRFGSRVTIVNHGPQIAARADSEAARELQAVLEDEGIEVLLDADVESVSRAADGVEARVQGRTIAVSHLLLASGRTPNVEELALDRVGVEVTRGGIVVDEHLRTTATGIWAAGDVAVGPMLTPIAQFQARVAIDDMYRDGSFVADYSVLPTSIFTDPELGGVGLTEQEARDRGFDVGVVKHPLSAVTRAQYTHTKRGLYKIVFETTTHRVLGVHVVSRGASDIVGSLAVALGLGATTDDLALVHHVYPSYSEGVKAAAEHAL
jgi:mercuric reductase